MASKPSGNRNKQGKKAGKAMNVKLLKRERSYQMIVEFSQVRKS
jgi:hypothetical protein